MKEMCNKYFRRIIVLYILCGFKQQQKHGSFFHDFPQSKNESGYVNSELLKQKSEWLRIVILCIQGNWGQFKFQKGRMKLFEPLSLHRILTAR